MNKKNKGGVWLNLRLTWGKHGPYRKHDDAFSSTPFEMRGLEYVVFE